MPPIQPTRSGSGTPCPKVKLVLKRPAAEVSATQFEADAEDEASAKAPHSFNRSPAQPAFPATPTKRTPVKNLVEKTSPFKGSPHSPQHAARLLERSSKRGDPREGLYSRFERNEPGLEYLNQTNALTQAKQYITTQDDKGNVTHQEFTAPATPVFAKSNKPAITAAPKPKLEDSFTRLLAKATEEKAQKERDQLAATTTPAPNLSQDPYAALLRDPATLEAYERKKAAAKKQSKLLDASLHKINAPQPTVSAAQSIYAAEKLRAETMTDQPRFFHALLRPCIIQILRAAGYHASKPTVVDALTDMAAKYMMTMATRTVNYAATVSNTTQVDVQHVRMAMQDLGALIPTMMIEDEILLPEGEDIRGVENFLEWTMGKENKEIRRVALEGGGEGGGGVDFLTALMRKHDNVEGADGTSRWDGTVLGKMLPPHEVIIEGDEITSIKEWNKAQARKRWINAKANDDAAKEKETNVANENDKDGAKTKTTNSTRQSSELSDLPDGDAEDVDMKGVEES